MAYSTGTSSSPSNLLDNLRAFLNSNGWTVTWRFQIAQGTWRWLHATKGGLFFNFWEQLSLLEANRSVSPNNVFCNYATSYNSSAEPFAQPGCNDAVGANAITPPYTAHHFFDGTGASGPYVYCALEIGAGEFAHFGVGILNKAGAYSGGEFACGTIWVYGIAVGANVQNNPVSSQNAWPFSDHHTFNGWAGNRPNGTVVRCPDALSGTHFNACQSAPAGVALRCGSPTFYSTNRSLGGGPQWLLWQQPTIPSIATAVLITPHCFGESVASNSRYIGHPPGLRHIALDFLSPGDEVVLGAETWKVFPLKRKGSISEIPLSGNYGLAYLKN